MSVEIKKVNKKEAYCLKFLAEENGVMVGRAFLYILYNDLHTVPFGFLEDVFVDSNYRKQGIGRQLVEAAIAEAKAQGCYKLICTSRFGKDDLHAWYEKFGFKQHGVEFRLDF